ncbi:hypothetical protein [Ruegeria sp. HKCCD6157]|uniref:hypothetical protein n=1 Tax=Ruegeria sp. HKCCD6157 TaxID=2690707 RepID=UPI001492EE6A|nr:hypothetical protein [Ruegeria sp. HKCCD6157]NOE24837.1 hypothetical protein [Ruegeria sp. HKCCD6157]
MFILPCSHESVAGIKRSLLRNQLRTTNSGFKSSHISQAIAAGFGYKSDAALKVGIDANKFYGYGTFDAGSFTNRLRELTEKETNNWGIHSDLVYTLAEHIVIGTGFVPFRLSQFDEERDELVQRIASKFHPMNSALVKRGIEEVIYRIEANANFKPKVEHVATDFIPGAKVIESNDVVVTGTLGIAGDPTSEFGSIAHFLANRARERQGVVYLSFSIFAGWRYRIYGAGEQKVYDKTINCPIWLPLIERAPPLQWIVEDVQTASWNEADSRCSMELKQLTSSILSEIVRLTDSSRARRTLGMGLLIGTPIAGENHVREILVNSPEYVREPWRIVGEKKDRQFPIAVFEALHELDMLSIKSIPEEGQPQGLSHWHFLNAKASRAVRHLRECHPEILGRKVSPKAA